MNIPWESKVKAEGKGFRCFETILVVYTVCLQWIWHVARKCWHDNKTICASSSEIFPRHETFMLTFLLCAFVYFLASHSLALFNFKRSFGTVSLFHQLYALRLSAIIQPVISSGLRNICVHVYLYRVFNFPKTFEPLFSSAFLWVGDKTQQYWICNERPLKRHETKYFWQVILGRKRKPSAFICVCWHKNLKTHTELAWQNSWFRKRGRARKASSISWEKLFRSSIIWGSFRSYLKIIYL